MNRQLSINYDAEADIFETIIGEPSSCVFEEVDDGIFEAHDEQSGELKGYKIFDFSKRSLRNIKIQLPANVDITGVS